MYYGLYLFHMPLFFVMSGITFEKFTLGSGASHYSFFKYYISILGAFPCRNHCISLSGSVIKRLSLHPAYTCVVYSGCIDKDVLWRIKHQQQKCLQTFYIFPAPFSNSALFYHHQDRPNLHGHHLYFLF